MPDINVALWLKYLEIPFLVHCIQGVLNVGEPFRQTCTLPTAAQSRIQLPPSQWEQIQRDAGFEVKVNISLAALTCHIWFPHICIKAPFSVNAKQVYLISFVKYNLGRSLKTECEH